MFFGTIENISKIYIQKKNAPKIEPSGTQEVMLRSLDNMYLNEFFCSNFLVGFDPQKLSYKYGVS